MTNANQLIGSLRAKVSQQKELLSRAKAELANQKQLKDRIAELESEVAGLKSSNPNSFNPLMNTNARRDIQSPAIKMPSRISLRSPQITNFVPPRPIASPLTVTSSRLYQESIRPPPQPSFYHPAAPPQHQLSEFYPVQFYPPPQDTNYPHAVFARPPAPPQSASGNVSHALYPTRPPFYDPRTSYSPSRSKHTITNLFYNSYLVRICWNNTPPTSSRESSLPATLINMTYNLNMHLFMILTKYFHS